MQLISMKDAPQQTLFDTTGHDAAFDVALSCSEP